jgi:hypothetical protein
MQELIQIHGNICNNCVELNAGDYLAGIGLFLIILLASLIIRRFRSR